MSNLKHYLDCDKCHKKIELESLKIEAEIVTKEIDGDRKIAVKYFFVCPFCGVQYTCFYKDKAVNDLFAQDMQEEAQERMEMLWELFEDGC